MILDIDNACYGTLSLSQMDDNLNKDTYFVDGEGDSVSFRVGYTILLSSGKKVGKLYTGEVKSVDIENGIIEILYIDEIGNRGDIYK